MPANYAHYRFGKLVLQEMPPQTKRLVQRFRRMFEVGLYGPDFFGFYNPLRKNAVGALANKFHSETGVAFFSRACAVAKSEAAKAYLYGVLAHYCLDSVCHPYVQKIVDIGEASHAVFEAEFDRFLLELDREPSPHTYDLSPRMKLTRGECATAAEFYPPATGGNVSRCLLIMRMIIHSAANPNRERTEKWMKRIKPGMEKNLLPLEEMEELSLYTQELYERYNLALEKYPRLLRQLQAYMQTGEELGIDFERDFG